MEGVVIRNYTLLSRIGGGSFGDVYLSRDSDSGNNVAIKVEALRGKFSQLLYETRIYKSLHSDSQAYDNGVPKVYQYIGSDTRSLMVMELLGPSLETCIAHNANIPFSLKTTVLLALQMMTSLEYIHSRGFVHRDVKPDNFALGRDSQAKRVFLIDYGLAKKYLKENGTHIPFTTMRSLTGTARYASINSHLGYELSRRDDLESLGYVLVYFLRGALPWQDLRAESKVRKLQKILEMKAALSPEELCKDLPKELVSYFHACRRLQFDEAPDYKYLRSLFHSILKRYNHKIDNCFDWVERADLFPREVDKKTTASNY